MPRLSLNAVERGRKCFRSQVRGQRANVVKVGGRRRPRTCDGGVAIMQIGHLHVFYIFIVSVQTVNNSFKIFFNESVVLMNSQHKFDDNPVWSSECPGQQSSKKGH